MQSKARWNAITWWASLALLGVGVAVVSAVRESNGLDRIDIVLALLERAAGSGLPALMWLGAATGIGRLLLRRALPASEGWTMAALAGNAAMILLCTVIGRVGLIGGATGLIVGWLVMMVGIGALLVEARRTLRACAEAGEGIGPPHGACCIGAIAVGIAAVACCLPPGTMWTSEARGYDVLSYHLALARQWLIDGAVHPVSNNVYSFLPSGMESAFALLGAMLGVGMRDGDISDGRWVLACQFLSLGMGILAATGVYSLVRKVVWAFGPDGTWYREIGAIAGACMICVPWVIVTGSEAYNEMAVLACFIGAWLAQQRLDLSVVERGATTGLLLGVAVVCKPTAAYMVVPAIVMLIGLEAQVSWRRRSVLPRVAVGMIVVGVASVAPWLIHNCLMSGNPVFPYGTGVFGLGDWTAEQVERWRSAHHVDLSVIDRLALLVSRDRGLLHPQWGIVVGLAGVGAVAAVVSGATRGLMGRPLAVIGVQLAAWLFIGHLQSRFLLPLVVPMAIVGLLGGVGLVRSGWRIGPWAGLVLMLALMIAPLYQTRQIFKAEASGRVGALLIGGTEAIMGSLAGATSELAAMAPQEVRKTLEELGPVGACNRLDDLERNAGRPPIKVMLLGDATTLYFRCAVVANTTWDTWPLLAPVREHPGDPGLWVDALRRMGVTHVLINLSELERLRWSGYSPPEMSAEFGVKLGERLGAPVLAWPEINSALFAVK